MSNFENTTPAERGRALAHATERARVRAVLDGALSDVKRTALNKTLNQSSRDAYDRAFNRLEAAARNQADFSSEDVVIPLRDSPPPLPNELHAWVAELAKVLKQWSTDISAVLKKEVPSLEVPLLAHPATTQVIKPGGPADSSYRETKGLSPDGTGLPVRGPGSNVDPEWIGK